MSSHSGSSGDLDTWEVVSRGSRHQPEGDESDSDSSIEVVSIDTDTECDLATPSSPLLTAGSVNPVFILRLHSTEAVIDALTAESDESADEGDDEGDDTGITKNLQVLCHRQDVETSSEEEERSDTAERSEEADTAERSEDAETAQRSEDTDTVESSGDLSSSNVSVTSISSDTDHTGDTATSPSVDDDDSLLVHTSGSTNILSSLQSLSEEHTLVDTTLIGEDSSFGTEGEKEELSSSRTDEDSSSRTDEDSSSRTDEDSSSRTESVMATEPFLLLPSLPPLPIEPDITAKVTGPVESSKPPSEAEEEEREGEYVPDNDEVENIVEDDDEEICVAVLEDFTVEPPEEFITEVTQPEDHHSNGESMEVVDAGEISAESSLTSSVQAEMTNSEIIGKTLGNVKYVAVVIVMAALCGYIVGSGACWNTPSIQTGLVETQREVATLQEQLSAGDTKIDVLQRSVEWMTEHASYDLKKLQSSNTELVFDPTFTAGYEYRYYLFTFGKYDAKNKELIRRDELTMEQIQRSNTLNWMDKVNRLEQEKADLILQIGMMRYGSPPSDGHVTSDNQAPGSPPSDGHVTSDNQAPGQADVGEQDFTWFTPDQSLEGQGHTEENHFGSEGQGHREDNDFGSEGTGSEEALKQEEKISTLETDLQLEKARSEMWQSMYLHQKESSNSETYSGKEILKQFSQLLQNFSVPEDFSENVKDKWELVRNQSLEGWQLMMDIASKMTTGTTQQDDVHQTTREDNSNTKPLKDGWSFDTESDEEDVDTEDKTDSESDEEDVETEDQTDSESDEEDVDTEDQTDSSSERKKKDPLPKWSETIQDVYNKTKSSMSDVSQQIQDTWEQVKNLSQDLWKEHEPSVTKLREKMSKKVGKVSEKLSAWFTRRRWNGKHKRHTRTNQHNSNEARSSQSGSTKRRSFTKEKDEEKDKHWRSSNEEKEENENDEGDAETDWGHPEFMVRTYQRRFLKLRSKLEKINVKKFMQMKLNHLRKCLEKIEKFVQVVDIRVLSSQNRKWLRCQRDWWFSIYTNVNMATDCGDVLPCWQASLATGQDPGKCDGSHGNDPRFKHRQQKGHRNGNSDQERRGDKARKQSQESQRPTSEQHYQEEKNTREKYDEDKFNDTSSDPRPSDESAPFCDPTSGDCPTSEPSWYIQQLKHREDLRTIVGEEGDSASEPDWMFNRAEDRDFQRTLPDDWYSRRLDNNQFKENEYFDDE